MDWYLKVVTNYFGFEGRARRTECWTFALVNIVIGLVLFAVDALIESGGLLSGIYNLAIFFPSLAVFIRRLHDIDKSGWWILFGIIPVIGPITLFVFSILEGNRGPNRFGPDPKVDQDGFPAVAA